MFSRMKPGTMTKHELFEHMFPCAKAKMSYLAGRLPVRGDHDMLLEMTNVVDNADLTAAHHISLTTILILACEAANGGFTLSGAILWDELDKAWKELRGEDVGEINDFARQTFDQCVQLHRAFMFKPYAEAIEMLEERFPV